MIDLIFRPWGDCNWLLKKYSIGDWAILSCLSTEKRSAASICHLACFAKNIVLVKIHDPTPIDVALVKAALNDAEKLVRNNVGSTIGIFDADLKAPLDDVADYVDKTVNCSENTRINAS